MNSTCRLCPIFLLLSAFILLTGCATSLTEKPSESGIIIRDGETVAFLGDSITAGGASYGKYCRLVIHGLKTKGIKVKPVLAGIPGNTSEHMLARLEKDVLSKKPDWVVLACGVNDIWHSDPTVKIGVFKPKPGMGVDLEGYKKNVTEIVDRCENARAKVILTTITPILESPEFKLNRIARKYNQFLFQLSEERGLPIAHLNEAMFAEIAKGKRLTSDGVHPLDNGHRVMAKGILKTMGLKQKDVDKLDKQWINSPSILILGDIQTSSGSRTGGWCHMLMDGMNSEKEMFTYSSIAQYRGHVTVKSFLNPLKKIETGNKRYLILQAPLGDVEPATPLPEYRKNVEELISIAKEKKMKPILVTIPIQQNDISSDLNKKIAPYNALLRDIAEKKGVLLADISKVMEKQYKTFPEQKLTFDGKRFNHKGAIIMARTIMRAMGLDSRITPELQKTWAERASYTDKYKKK